MSLIEHLEDGDWRGALRRSFEGAIRLLQTDRFGRCSSAALIFKRARMPIPQYRIIKFLEVSYCVKILVLL
ncbi:hypothetical protein NIES2101_26100 [Calothrix sp. HK-06]|nr:hypothetical protein NIES2101_26100 [Calothrix sp. HK-06]